MNTFPTTWLFCPANRPERYAKAFASGAPGVVIDLEDAVPTTDKDSARTSLLQWLGSDIAAQASSATRLAIRINRPESDAGLNDLQAMRRAPGLAHAHLLLLPKVASPEEVQLVAAHLLRAAPQLRLMALIESIQGVRRVAQIAAAHSSLAALGFGAADLAAELGIASDWEALLYARSQVLLAAAGKGLPVLDVPWLQIDDTAGLVQDCARALRLGFHGKFAIHPKQVAGIVAGFRPQPAQLERAQRYVQAYTDAGGAACAVDGTMVDEPVYLAALRLLARAG
ncbi:MAG: CoA ester lyase [Polaromonas sp.]|nr:CoA ester lyase [Polaromonas sp.]